MLIKFGQRFAGEQQLGKLDPSLGNRVDMLLLLQMLFGTKSNFFLPNS